MTLDIAAIRAREAAATPGPWEIRSNLPYSINGKVIFSGRFEKNRTILRLGDGYSSDADVEFIAAARTDIPALCDAVERLTAEREALRAIVGRYGRHDRMCLPHQDGTCDCGFDQARAKVEATDDPQS